MKKIVRNVFALLLALTFILSLAACGGNSASSGAAPAASGSEETSTVASTPETKDPVTLTVYTWWDVTKFEHLQKMKSDFEAENPDIKLEFVTIPSKYADTMITKLAAGEIPDVMMLAMDQVEIFEGGVRVIFFDKSTGTYTDSSVGVTPTPFVLGELRAVLGEENVVVR